MAALRRVVQRFGQRIMVDDRFPLQAGEVQEMRMAYFRMQGCFPPTSATESQATTANKILAEIRSARTSERHGSLSD
jgi:sulfate adenylyltransferase subunit 2